MAETPRRPAQQRSGGDIWKWVIGIIVVLLLIWIIAGLLGNGIDDDPMAPPPEEDPPPPQQEQPQQEQPQQQEPQQQNETRLQSFKHSAGDEVRGAVAMHDMTAIVDWPVHLTQPYGEG